MYITIKKPNDTDANAIGVNFPCEQNELSRICNELGIVETTEKNCCIVNAMDGNFIGMVKENYCNIDELNFLIKRMESLTSKEKNILYASADATGVKTIMELINLTYNTHCYSIIKNFNKLHEEGREIYLNEMVAVNTEELNNLNGMDYVEELMKSGQLIGITVYGVVFQNKNQPKLIYNGKTFPCYHWRDEVATVELEANGVKEYLYLPSSHAEVEKALRRLNIDDITQCNASIESDYFTDPMVELLTKGESIASSLDHLNEFAALLKDMGSNGPAYFEKLVEYTSPRNEIELKVLAEHYYEFELFDRIRDAEQYGRYMICDSGRFEYDSILEGYIDFKSYGQKRINYEGGVFTDKGYLIYHGSNWNLQTMLSENFGMKIKERTEPIVLKLYMPLKIITYDLEYEYEEEEDGLIDMTEEISPSEALDYKDDIFSAMEKMKKSEETRGLMSYYKEQDSINAKVISYEFTVEPVEGELMGVAVLKLNQPLDERELEKMKEVITGQASDGYGESLQQRSIETMDDRDIYVSLWNSDKGYEIRTEEELKSTLPGFGQHGMIMGGM